MGGVNGLVSGDQRSLVRPIVWAGKVLFLAWEEVKKGDRGENPGSF